MSIFGCLRIKYTKQEKKMSKVKDIKYKKLYFGAGQCLAKQFYKGNVKYTSFENKLDGEYPLWDDVKQYFRRKL